MEPQESTTTTAVRSRTGKIFDWVFVVFLLAVGCCLEFELLSRPNAQYIPGLDTNENYNFGYPDVEATVSTVSMMALMLVPVLVIFAINAIILRSVDAHFAWKEVASHFAVVSRMHLFSFSLSLIVVDFIKLYVGSPRPYFLEVYELYQANEVDEAEVLEARLSFPSGHAAYPMSQLLLLSMMLFQSWQYVQKTMFYRQCIVGMTSSNPHAYYSVNLWWLLRDAPLVGIILVFSPIFLAIWCGLTRIRDYKHFAADVVTGFILGGFIAYISFLAFFNEIYLEFNKDLNDKLKACNAKKSDGEQKEELILRPKGADNV